MRKRAKKARQVKRQAEHFIQDALQELIVTKYRWRCWENKVHGAVQMRFGGWIGGCGTKGMSDLTALVPVPGVPRAFYVFHLECKSKSGRQKPEQKAWQEQVEACGEFYLVARSQQDVMGFVIAKGWAK